MITLYTNTNVIFLPTTTPFELIIGDTPVRGKTVFLTYKDGVHSLTSFESILNKINKIIKDNNNTTLTAKFLRGFKNSQDEPAMRGIIELILERYVHELRYKIQAEVASTEKLGISLDVIFMEVTENQPLDEYEHNCLVPNAENLPENLHLEDFA